MESQRIKISLDDETLQHLTERAKSLDKPVATLAREILEDAVFNKRKAEIETELFTEIQKMNSNLQTVLESLEPSAQGPGNDKLQKILERNLRWIVLSAVTIDRVAGLVLNNEEEYVRVHDQSEALASRLFNSLLKEIEDETR